MRIDGVGRDRGPALCATGAAGQAQLTHQPFDGAPRDRHALAVELPHVLPAP
jgi:hypothetical protein